MAADGTPPITPGRVAFEHAETGFTAIGAPDFELTYNAAEAEYTLASADRYLTFVYARMSGASIPHNAVLATASNSGLTATSHVSTAAWARVEATGPDGAQWVIQAARDDADTVKLTAHVWTAGTTRTPEQLLDDERVLATLFASARGGAMLPQAPRPSATAPASAAQPAASAAQPAASAAQPAAPAQPIPLRQYAIPDGSASMMVPDEPDWLIEGAAGSIFANHRQAEMLMGIYTRFLDPMGPTAQMMRSVGQVMPGMPATPRIPAEQALVTIWAGLHNEYAPSAAISNVQITSRDQTSSTQWRDYGVFGIQHTRAGAPWRGAVAVSVSQNPLDDYWRCDCSSILVAADAAPRIWQALVSAWVTFRPASQGPSQADLQIRQIRADSDSDTFDAMRELVQKQREAAGLAEPPEEG
jgi:hypothetical protein